MKLGNTSITISPLCLGTMYFGTKTDQIASEKLLDQFLGLGGNFIDTANNYAFWMENGVGDESETVIGKWLAKGERRTNIVLATKCGGRPQAYTGDLKDMGIEGLGYQTILKAVDQSLQRLQTDYIDLLYAHIDFMEYPIDERLRAFEELYQAGKVRAIGSSNTSAWRLEESLHHCQGQQWVTYSAVQQKYSYLRPRHHADFWVQKLINEEMIQYCEQRGLTLLAYSTLLSGLYAKDPVEIPDDYDTKDNALRLKILTQVAQELGASKNQVVLAWMMQHQPAIVPIIAASKPEQIQESMGSIDIKLTPEQMETLDCAGW